MVPIHLDDEVSHRDSLLLEGDPEVESLIGIKMTSTVLDLKHTALQALLTNLSGLMQKLDERFTLGVVTEVSNQALPPALIGEQIHITQRLYIS